MLQGCSLSHLAGRVCQGPRSKLSNARRRLIGDSQTERWYDSIECFLAEFLEQEARAAPLQETSANLWLMNLDERLHHRGSFWSPPKPAICAHYKVPHQCLQDQPDPITLRLIHQSASALVLLKLVLTTAEQR